MNRRDVMKLSAVVPLMMSGQEAKAADSRTFVLVHGAFHGGWCWGPVAQLIRERGHRVFTPSQTGSGERAHLMSTAIDLNTYIRDITAVIETEELNNVILVGHSFGGWVITGVADRMPELIATLVYLDASFGSNGDSVFSMAPPEVREARIKASKEVDGTRIITPPSSTVFGVTEPSQVQWVDRRMTPMPFKTYDSPLSLKGPPGGNLPKLFIRCTKPTIVSIDASAKYAKERGWRYVEIETGHDAMVSAPKELTAILLDVATARS